MKISDMFQNLQNSSWLSNEEAVMYPDYGWTVSLYKKPMPVWASPSDTTYTVQDKDRLDLISQTFYGTPNYAPMLYFLNPHVGHPCNIKTGVKITIPSNLKIMNLISYFSENQ